VKEPLSARNRERGVNGLGQRGARREHGTPDLGGESDCPGNRRAAYFLGGHRREGVTGGAAHLDRHGPRVPLERDRIGDLVKNHLVPARIGEGPRRRRHPIDAEGVHL
jgi:hypothetical protein